MAEKLPYFVIVRADAEPSDIALAAVEAMNEMDVEQTNDIQHCGYAQTCAVPSEGQLRDLIAEAVINGDHITVGNLFNGGSGVVAVIGPSHAPGPLLRAAMGMDSITLPAPAPPSPASGQSQSVEAAP